MGTDKRRHTSSRSIYFSIFQHYKLYLEHLFDNVGVHPYSVHGIQLFGSEKLSTTGSKTLIRKINFISEWSSE